ncbi:hypothetical protein GV791_25025 [Nocardia cyriacigeorgica]|uniref:Uncharacterized protein n=1 Tax=Nocardia cyriacigeorgica TaxID=135487 RepID=A0A6P1CZU8_9NOCA|nr:hypothetical protein [Nocardia cyriacigeorgica]NEW35805.1 hypothetical protein [Nocardia cyriacigeorgica]
MTTSHPTRSELHVGRAELTRFVREQAERTRDELGFGWIGVATAPSTYQQLRAAFARSTETGDPLPVSSLFCESTIYEAPDDNVRFRYYHDVHHVRLGLSFNLDDELELAQWHLDELSLAGFGKGSLPYELMTADLVGQIFLMGVIGRFPLDQGRFVATCHEAGLVSGLLAEIRRLP